MRKSILFSAAVSILLASTAAAQDGTDDCNAPTAIGEGTFAFDTMPMVGSDDLPGCNSNLFGAGPYFNQDMFWVYTATTAGDLTIDTVGTTWDTQLAIHSGIDCMAVCIDNDDDSAPGGSGLQSALTLPGVTIGDTFVIQVGGFGSAAGIGALNVAVGGPPPPPMPPANDDCSTATLIPGVGAFPFDATDATDSTMVGDGACSSLRPSTLHDVFFSFTAPTGGQYTFSTEHHTTSYDTVMALYGGPVCGPTAPCIGHNDDFGPLGFGSSVTVGASAGDVILIQIGGWSAGEVVGPNILTVDGPNPPANDDCGTATDLTGTGAFPFDPRGASDSGFQGDGTCSSNNASLQDVFFTWTATSDDLFTFSTEHHSTSYDTRMVIYAGNACDPTSVCLGENDDAGGALGFGSSIDLNLLTGDLVTVQIGGWSGSTTVAPNILTIAGYVDPCDPMNEDIYEDNDDCATAIALPAGVYTDLFTTDMDTDWFTISVPAGEIGTVLLNQQSGDTDVTVMAPDCIGVYGTVAAGFTLTNSSAAAIDLVFNAWNDNAGSTCSIYDLDISFAPDPCGASNDDAFEDNDDCASAVAMTNGTHAGLWVSDSDEDYYSFCVGNGDTINVDILFIDADGDLDLVLSDSACGSTLDSSGGVTDIETVTWTNNTGADMDVVLFVNFFGTGCNNYDMVVAGSGNCNGYVGTMYCAAELNSTGVVSSIFGTGDLVAANNAFGLLATGLPDGEFGYFIGSFGQAQVNMPGGSNGNLCVGGGQAIARFIPTLGAIAGGQITGAVDLTNVPLPPSMAGMIMGGDTFNFQLWHREGGPLSGQSNFTPGLEVTFQ